MRSRKLSHGYKRWETSQIVRIMRIAGIIEMDTSLLLFPYMSPARCFFTSAADSHRRLLTWKTDNAQTTWALLHTVFSLEMRTGLWPSWGLDGGNKKEPIFWKSQKDWGLSKWNPSLTLSDGMHFLLERSKDEAGRIPESKVGFAQNRSRDNDLSASR